MTSSFKVVDPSDPNWPLGPFTVFKLDLNDWVAGSTTSGLALLHDPDFGSIDTAAEWAVQPGIPGAVQTSRTHPVTTMSIRLGAAHTNYDSLITKIRSLAQALDPNYQGMYGQNMGIIQWQPDVTSNPYYIDFYPSPMPTILDGTEMGLYKTLRLLQKPDGLKVLIWRHPYLRGPVLNASVNVLNNSTLLEDGDNNGVPDHWFMDSQTGVSAQVITFTSSVKASQFTLATGNTRKLRQGTVNPLDSPYGVSHAASPGDVWTLSFYSSASGSGCTSTAVIEYLSSTGTVLQTNTGTGVTMTTSAQLSTVTGSAAPASTAFVRANLQIQNASGSNRVITLGDGTGQGAQLEKAAAASTFRVGTESVRNDVGAEAAPIIAISAAVGAAGNVNAGQHFYRMTFVTADGETVTGPSVSVNPGVASIINLTNIISGSNRITARKIWRTKAAQADTNANYFLVTTINDNTTSSFNDNIADASLPGGNPNTTGITAPPDQGHVWSYNPGNAPALVQARTVPENTAQMIGVLFGQRSTKDGDNLAEFVNSRRMAARVADGTLYTDTAATAVGANVPKTASGGRGALTTHSTTTALVRRWRINVTPTNASALQGTFGVWVNAGFQSLTTFNVQMRYGFGSATEDPLPIAGDVIPLDTTNVFTSITLQPLFLGYVNIPPGAAGLYLEGWSGAGGIANAVWDTVELVPADESTALLVSPGFRSAGFGQDQWLGARNNATVTDFVQPSVITSALPSAFKGGQIILSTGGATPHACGTPPTGGTVLQPGRHVYTAHGSLYNTTQDGTKLGELRIYDVTAGGAAVATVPLTSKANQVWTGFGDPGQTVVAQAVVDVPAANTHFYQADVVFTHATTTGFKIYLSDITHQFVPTYGDGSTIMGLDGDKQIARSYTSALAPLDPLVAPVGYLSVAAGLNLVTVDEWDVAPNGMDAIDARAPLAQHYMDRDATVSLNIIPRYTPL